MVIVAATHPLQDPQAQGGGGITPWWVLTAKVNFLVQISCREVDWERGTQTYWFLSVLFLTTTRGIAQDLAVGFW